ncbi:MAG: hypothetical protein WC789_06985 [Lentisphaeria bacterium]
MTSDALFQAAASYLITPTGPGVPVAVVAALPGPGVNPTYVDLWVAPYLSSGEGYQLDVDPGLTDVAGNPMVVTFIVFVAPVIPAWSAETEYLPPLEVITGIIGEELAEVGGYRQTRLTAEVAAGDGNLFVETTLDWPAAGEVGVDGVVYEYTGITPTAFTGISHVRAGVVTPGAACAHRLGSTVADLTREWSALDKARRGFLVDTAEGEDLTTLARNLGVPRLRMFTSDAQYRGVVRAIAYCPRGTLWALEQALTALVGAGNYEIYEDLVKDPCRVTIRIDPAVLASAGAPGKAWMTTEEWATLDLPCTGLTLAASPDRVYSARPADLNALFDFRNALPSATFYFEYPGGPPIVPFTYTGADPEGAAVLLTAGSHISLLSAGGTVLYEMGYLQGWRGWQHGGTADEKTSRVVVNALVRVPSVHVWVPGDEFQLSFHDGWRRFLISLTPAGASTVTVTCGSGANFTMSMDEWHELEIRRTDPEWLELWYDGQYMGRSGYTTGGFPIPGLPSDVLSFGFVGASAGLQVDVRQLGAKAYNPMDYWAQQWLGAPGAAPTQFDDALLLLGAGQVGKTIVLRNSWAVNAQGGNNNFVGRVASEVIPGSVLLEGRLHAEGATVDSAAPTRVTVDDHEAFTYPDDLGKTLVISGSALGNDGSYTIVALLEEGTLVDLATYGTQYPAGLNYNPRDARRTGVAVVAAAAFTSEPDLDWRMDPAFVVEPLVGMAVHAVSYECSDCGVEAAGVLTLPIAVQTGSVPGILMVVHEGQVKSAQLLPGVKTENDPMGTYWPFYLSDLIGFLDAYLYPLLAAGIIPRFEAMI